MDLNKSIPKKIDQQSILKNIKNMTNYITNENKELGVLLKAFDEISPD